MTSKCLTITYLSSISYASLNGSDKEADNISSIKKITINGEEYPYVSSQAIRRALREQLAVLGYKLSEGMVSEKDKGASTTECNPVAYIDDDLFGYMNAKKETVKRTSAVRVSPAISLTPYVGELDFGTNYMGVGAGGNPNIFETEIHSGVYRGTILIELDRIGTGEGFEKQELENEVKLERASALLDAIKNLWIIGRQSRFLADFSPKFFAAALLKVKNPIFLEVVKTKDNTIDMEILNNTINDFVDIINKYDFGIRKGFFIPEPDNCKTLKEALDNIKEWIEEVYKE